MPEWTNAQKTAICLDDENSGIIVSAAAGSGKTAVLAERISRHAATGKDLSGLIAVTFTRDAASEIKNRVTEVLRRKYAETKDTVFKKGAERLRYAKIGTIDSLFKTVVKENFATVGISPDFSYVDDTEDFAIKDENLNEILDGYYTDYRNNFEAFLSVFGGDRDDEKIKNLINGIYTQLLSVPFWEKWFEEKIKNYSDAKFFTDAACELYSPLFEEYETVYKKTLESGIVGTEGLPFFMTEYAFISKISALVKEKKWDETVEGLTLPDFGEKLTKFKLEKSEEKEIFQKYRNDFKERIFKNEIFKIKAADAAKDLEKLKPSVVCLFEILKEYDKKNLETYAKLGRYPIAAISRFALSLAVSEYDHKTRNFVPTEFAKKMSEEYFEVIIDEYQDSNDLQDLFFTAISNGGKNLFVVGDVKQSIYKFRYAEPKNFIRKTKELRCLHLSENFRSKKSILDFTNFICSGVFSEKLYENPYPEEDRLSAFRKEEDGGDVEIYLVDTFGAERKDEEQAKFCADKIKEIIRSGYEIFDKNLGRRRPAAFSDFAILVPTGRLVKIHEDALKKAGIPAVSDVTASIFDTVEVNVMISLLEAVDNPYNDLSLAAAMLSDIFAFTEDEISEIRGGNRNVSLYENCLAAEPENEKIANLLHSLRRFRLLSENMTADRLLWKMLTETDFITKAACGEFGYVKRDNLLRFYEFSKKYTDAFSGGLYGFLSFIDVARQKEAKEEFAFSGGNYVRVMTHHKSKGLEFPICILSSAFYSYNGSDGDYLFDRRFGFVSGDVSEDGFFKYKTLHCEIAKAYDRCASKAEKMRVLYVALTRARDRLIIVGGTNTEKIAEEAAFGADLKNGVPLLRTENSNSLGKLIMSALIYYPNIVSPFDFPNSSGDDRFFPIKVLPAEISEKETEETEEKETVDVDISKIKENISFEYDASLSKIPAKLSVTELVKTRYREDADGDLLIADAPTVRRPEFIDGKKDGTFFGNAMHRFLNFADLEKSFETERARLIAEKKITAAEAAVLRKEKVEEYKKSDVYKAVKNAPEVIREEDFVVPVPASFYDKTATGGEVLLQGAMDICCIYDDGLVIVDYKTDRLSEEELISKYSFQLYLYSVAAEKMYSLPVKKAYIWSFGLGKGIDVTPFFA